MMMSFSENEILLDVAGGRFAVLHVVELAISRLISQLSADST